MLFLHLALTAVLLCAPVSAQYSYYALTKTLTLSNAAITSYSLQLKFYKVDIPSLVFDATIGSTKYKLYFYPKANQLCIQNSALGTTKISLELGSFDNFSITALLVNLNGASIQYDSGTSKCPHSTTLIATNFSEAIGQLKIVTSAAAAISTELSGLVQLADQSCLSKPASSCTECVNGYKLANTPATCQIMPYGCLRADASGLCVECRYGFDFDATSSRCHKGRGNFMRLGTQALVSRNSLNGDPTINHAPPLTAWTIQFYLMVQPSSKNFGTFMHRFLVASGGTDSLELQLDYQYNMGLPINDLKISFIHWGGSIQSGPKTISKGEWIFASFYMVTGPTSYDLLIFKHGTTTIGATGSIALSQTILKLNSADLTIYLKQLIIWNQSFSADPNINSHACRFAHPGTFLPTSLYKFDIDTIAGTTSLPDSIGTYAALDGTYLSGTGTYSDLIYELQPISNLEDNFFQEGAGGLPICMECTPDCAACSDIYTCTSCASGILQKGICHSTAITPLSGTAGTTKFSYTATYDIINQHINSELFLNPNSAHVQVSSYYVKYPDDSTHTITSLSSFTVPKYGVVGLTSFNAEFRVAVTINGNQETVTLATLTLSQVYSQAESIKDAIVGATISVSSDNWCGCSVHATCNIMTGRCECFSGYAGTHCQFSEQALQNYESQITQEVNRIIANQASISSDVILTDLEYLSRESDALTPETAQAILDLTTSLYGPSSSLAEQNLSLEIYSHVSVAASRSSQIDLASGTQAGVKKILFQLLPSSTNIVLTSSRITLRIQPYDPSTANVVSLSTTSNSTVVIPTGLADPADDIRLVTIIYEEPIFQPLAPHSFISATDVITIELYVNGEQRPVEGLTEPVHLNFALDSTDQVIQDCVESIINGTETEASIRCSFFDPTLRSTSSEGCQFMRLDQSELKCACTHMTDFMGFVSPALQILRDSNYDVFLAITQLNYSNLKVNLGFHFAAGYILLFLFLLLILSLLDCRQFKNKFEEQLYLAVHQGKKNENKDSLGDSNSKHSSALSLSITSTPGSVHPLTKLTNDFQKRKEISAYQEEDIGSCVGDGLTLTGSESKQTVKVNSFFQKKEQKKSKFSSQETDIESNSTLSIISAVDKIKIRLTNILQEESRSRKSCCCLFQRLARDELATNNQTYNLFATFNPLSRRNTRLMFCYMAVLLEFSLCALFFNLSPESANEDLSLSEEVLQNFWVGLFSTLFTIFPLIIVGCFFSFPRKWIKRLQKATTTQELRIEYTGYIRRIRCRLACNVACFMLFSAFFLLYIICFCHVATPTMAREWLISSMISILLDVLIFELSAAIGFAFCGTLKGMCRGCNGMICFIVILELYRLYRNLVEG